ncbi:aldose 1-epimerase family protein [Butyrivibrio sp. AE2032]|uniref:aldose 1-epimerase family protein n=1 Tax=Butyrivibrio sp. AE2032 TaxID=1458463 RepID=UPI0005527592|nr:aldose 1-epimerase family protein [Butyrivibrio sp. AE2032]
MKEYTISNETYTLTVSDHGAEIRSLKKNGKELMWQADPAFWGRTSPVLFPLVGNYWEKKSRWGGKTFEMSQHGFARDMDFVKLEQAPDSADHQSSDSQTEDELWFELRDNSETLKKYPFAFILQLGYKLSKDGVEVLWKVKNPSDKDIFFSIGGHPAFNCDLTKDQLLFTKKGQPLNSALKANIIEGDGSGCLSDRTKELSLDAGKLPLSYELFDEDALIIENDQADAVAVLDPSGKELLTVSFDSPLFGVWSPAGKKAPFVCIEPWYGRCDKVGFTDDISEREYGNKLAPQEEFLVSYKIR